MVDDHEDTDTKMTRRTPTVNFKVLSLTFEEQSVEITFVFTFTYPTATFFIFKTWGLPKVQTPCPRSR